MRWSWRIGQLAGIGVYLHSTLFMLLIYVVAQHLWRGQSLAMVVMAVVSVAGMFSIVVLHELGHALAARRYGIQTQDITLLPIGGVARLERMPDDPKEELVVALAGPAVNVVLGMVGFLLIVLLHSRVANMYEFRLVGGNLLVSFVQVNEMLIVFNLLPAFPMDGGRVLRALLAMKLDYAKATQVAATVGQVMAFLFGLVGLMYGQYFLLFIALFVWMGAAAELELAQTKSALRGALVREAMITDFQTLSPLEPLSHAVQHVLAGFQQDFPVLDDGRLVGVLTRGALLKEIANSSQDMRVGDAMQRQFETAAPGEMLDQVFHRLQDCDCRTLPVVEDGVLVGMVTMDNLGEFMVLRSALRGSA